MWGGSSPQIFTASSAVRKAASNCSSISEELPGPGWVSPHISLQRQKQQRECGSRFSSMSGSVSVSMNAPGTAREAAEQKSRWDVNVLTWNRCLPLPDRPQNATSAALRGCGFSLALPSHSCLACPGVSQSPGRSQVRNSLPRHLKIK